MWQFTVSHAHIFHPQINCRDCFNIISKGYRLLKIKLIHDVDIKNQNSNLFYPFWARF